jgi:transcriptional regulatory protein RtcR
MKRKVVIGLLGTVLDSGYSRKRWEKWRPTVSIGQFEDFLVDRIEILHPKPSRKLAEIVRDDLNSVSPESDVLLHRLDFADPWDFEEVYGTLYDFARNYPFDTEEEEYYLHITTGTHVAQICLFLLSESRVVPGSLLQTSPPERSRKGGSGIYSVIDLDLTKYSEIHARFNRQARDDIDFLKSGIATRNAPFNRMIEEIEHVAIQSASPLLLLGPTGAGKSELASRIFALKKNHNAITGEFVEVNCATLRGDQAMAMIFGHTKGAFTGAVNARGGLMKKADGGILFLDEIGELDLDAQAMLLRALESGQYLPVGSDHESSSRFQLIAGSNRDLSKRVREGEFRQDLLARINLWTFSLPGLANRPEDIEPNVEFEIERFALTQGRNVRFAAEAHTRFLQFATSTEATWTGNFRDLNAAITRMATLSRSGVIYTETVEAEIRRLRESWDALNGDASSHHLSDALSEEEWKKIDRFDQQQLSDVIGVCRQSRSLSDAGRKLFGVSRLHKKSNNDSDRLRKYLAKFDLSWRDVTESHV